MKQRWLFTIGLLLLAAMSASAADYNVLVNGASASQGLHGDYLPEIAAADGLDVHTELLMLDDSDAILAMNAILAGSNSVYGYEVTGAKGDPALTTTYAESGYVRYANDRDRMVHLGDIIASTNWDAVVLSINTHLAVDRDIFKTDISTFPYYTPSVTNRSATFQFKKDFFTDPGILPDADLYLFQNLSPRNDSNSKIPNEEPMLQNRGTIGPTEILTEDTWAEISAEHFSICADELDLEPIFAGDILYWIRRDPSFGYLEASNHVVAAAIYNATNGPDYQPPWTITNDLRQNFVWNVNNVDWRVDHHPEENGNYMMGALAYETIFGSNVVGNTYVPNKMSQGEVTELQNLVHDLAADPYKYPLHSTQQIELDRSSLEVPEGSNALFQVRLTQQPVADTTVSVARVSGGDTDLAVQSGASRVFSSITWSNWQSVTLSAGQDPDFLDGEAVFRCSSPGLDSRDIQATENDDEENPAYALPWSESFETRTAGPIDSQNGWVSGSNAVVQSATALDTQALALTDDMASHTFVGSPTNVWISFWMQGVTSEAAPDVPAGSVAAFYINTNSQLVVFDGTSETTTAATVSNGWNNVEIFADYVSKVWNLSLNGTEAAADLGFYADQSAFSAFGLSDGSTNTTYFDDIEISDSTDDSDGDGLPDAWEQQYWPGDLSHTGGETASNGVNTVEEAYIAGIDPTDTDAAFLISELSPLASESILQWQNVSGRVYSVYWTSNLLSGFPAQPFTNGLTGGAYTDSTHGVEQEGFYKIEVELE